MQASDYHTFRSVMVPHFLLPSELCKTILTEKTKNVHELAYVKAKLTKTTDAKLGMSARLSQVNCSRFFSLFDAKTASTNAFPLRPQCESEQLNEIYDILPCELASELKDLAEKEKTSSLCEIRLDSGLPPRIALSANIQTGGGGIVPQTPKNVTYCTLLSNVTTRDEHILHILSNENVLIADEKRNRMYIKNTMHRVCAIIEEDTVESGTSCTALTIRCGRHIPMASSALLDVILNSVNGSVLVIGPPGSGKTTVMRSMACLASGDAHTGCNASSNVFVVDTSRELGFDSVTCDRVTHYGYARVVKATKQSQNSTMEEILLNHFPTVIAIDELEASAVPTVRRIAASGVRLFATAHASSLQDALSNPVTASLLGEAHTVIRSDSSAMQGVSLKKSTLERTKDPIFGTVVQLTSSGFMVWQGKEHLSAGIDTILASDGNEDILSDFGAPQCRMWAFPKKEEDCASTPNEEEFLISIGWKM